MIEWSRLSEVDLRAAYARAGWEARPCACGSVVVADRLFPTEGVRRHQAQWAHLVWRAEVGL